jgi:lipoprotein-anchoring transpeptidase ErfK/SrfK
MPGMGRHRQVRGGRRVAPRTRPRYSRLWAASGSLVITLVAVLGGAGLLPTGRAPGAAATADLQATPAAHVDGRNPDSSRSAAAPTTPDTRGDQATAKHPEATLPANSGTGRRIVFAMGAQRVWLVSGADHVRRTYLVSGSVTDNLRPGSYSVYSKSEHAVGIDDSGTMRYMVRFAHGSNAAIGFHDIPVLHGALVQTRAELGSPRSHGCIRQWRPDAKALWRFAPVGTEVDVVA